MRKMSLLCFSLVLVVVMTVAASGQSFQVQCPDHTITHPNAADNNSEPAYPSLNGVNGAIKCQQISGGDGFATMADGTQTYLFAFGPLSGLADMANGQPGTQFPNIFNAGIPTTVMPGDPATADGVVADSWPLGFPGNPLPTSAFTHNGAVGLANTFANIVSIFDISEVGQVVTVVTSAPSGFKVGDQVVISGASVSGYTGTFTVTAVNVPNSFYPSNHAFTYTSTTTGLAEVNEPANASASSPASSDGHVDVRQIMDVGVLNGNMPAPLMAIDEDDEFFLTLTNVGQVMRPDLFEQHTVHFHGYPNASAFYDGVPDASVAINIGGSFTYYYLAPEAGTYFWHCHITPPEHLQMGMVGQIYVRPRQNRVTVGTSLYTARAAQDTDLRTACVSVNDILCSNPLPRVNTNLSQGFMANGHTYTKYAYNDGDGSTAYDVEYPLQIHGFDPNFHFVGMTFNPEGFTEMKDKYFLLNGRSYPDTVTPGPLATQTTDGTMHFSQPLPSIINIPAGGRALLRIADLDVTEYQTLASLGIPMQVIGLNAKLLRDQAGNNLYYKTNSITLAGGESLDVILDASDTTKYPAGSVFYLYTPNLDHLSNDAENFGGLMTEVRITAN